MKVLFVTMLRPPSIWKKGGPNDPMLHHVVFTKEESFLRADSTDTKEVLLASIHIARLWGTELAFEETSPCVAKSASVYQLHSNRLLIQQM